MPRGEERKGSKKGVWMESLVLGPKAAEGQRSWDSGKQVQCQENQGTCWGDVSQAGCLSHFSGEASYITPMLQNKSHDSLLAF